LLLSTTAENEPKLAHAGNMVFKDWRYVGNFTLNPRTGVFYTCFARVE
jgi:hypothetical protein